MLFLAHGALVTGTALSPQSRALILHFTILCSYGSVSLPPVQLLLPLLQLYEHMSFCRAHCCIKAD